jgi:protein TonB
MAFVQCDIYVIISWQIADMQLVTSAFCRYGRYHYLPNTNFTFMHFYIENPWENPSSHERMELVFDGRFKEYGAYLIRKQYARNKVVAMLLSAVIVATCAGFVLLKGSKPAPRIVISSRPELPVADSIAYFDPKDILGGGSSGSGSSGERNEPSGLIPGMDPLAPPSPGNIGPGASGTGWGEEGLPNPFNGLGGAGEAPENQGASASGNKLPASQCYFYTGEEGFVQYVKDHFVTPASCADGGALGFARVRFMVNQHGRISQVEILESSNSCPEFQAEAKRVLRSSPRWVPAKVNGTFVSCWREMQIQLVY